MNLEVILCLFILLLLLFTLPWKSWLTPHPKRTRRAGSLGEVLVLVIEPSNPDVLYALAGFAHTDVFKSSDGGEHWQKISRRNAPLGDVNLQYVNGHATDLVLDPTPPHPLYVCCGGHFGGLYKSTDNGLTWQEVASTGGHTFFPDSLCVDPSTPNLLYARGTISERDHSHRKGIFKSTDGGESWTLVYQCAAGVSVHSLILAPSKPPILYASTYGQGNGDTAARSGPAAPGGAQAEVLTSEDGGVSWTSITGNLPSRPVDKLVVAPTSPLHMYAGLRVNKQMGECEIFTRLSGGDRWENIQARFPQKTVTDWCIDPTRPHLWYAFTTRGHFRSHDAGTTWRRMPCQGLPLDEHIWTFVIDPCRAETLHIGMISGVFKSTDGGDTWNVVNDGLLGRA